MEFLAPNGSYLPCSAEVPLPPFAGQVINVNFKTRIHRDTMDDTWCLALPLGQWEGCDLVLDELGLVFDLRPGHFLFFRSRDLSHFNLDFKGKRLGLIFHNDLHLKSSVRVYQRWGKERPDFNSHLQTETDVI